MANFAIMDPKKKSRKKIISRIINVVLVAVLVIVIVNPGAKAWVLKQLLSTGMFKPKIKAERAGNPVAPAFNYMDAAGKSISSEELRGKVVFINIWASWCPPCRAEMPGMNEMYNELKNENRIVFVFLNEDEDLVKANTYLNKNQYSIPIMKANGAMPSQIFNGSLPTTVILDKEGRVVMRKEGIADYSGKGFIEELKRLME